MYQLKPILLVGAEPILSCGTLKFQYFSESPKPAKYAPTLQNRSDTNRVDSVSVEKKTDGKVTEAT